MRCKMCHKKMYYDISIKDLFVFNFVCHDCAKLLKPKLVTIPIDNGHLLYYYYFLLEEEYDEKIERKIYPVIMDMLYKRKRKMYFFLDDDFLLYFKYLNFNEDIYLISIVYEDLSYYLEND